MIKKNILVWVSACIATFAGTSYAQQGAQMEAKSPWKFRLGVMGQVRSELLYSDKNENTTVVFPVASIEYKNIYLRGWELGYKMGFSNASSIDAFINASSGVGLLGVSTPLLEHAIDADDMENGYRGINDRDRQFIVGLRFNYEFAENFLFELEGTAGERGTVGEAELKYTFKADDHKWAVSPFYAFRAMDSDFVDYYFSISDSEAANPESYKIDGAYKTGDFGYANSIGVSGMYRMTDHITLVSKFEVQNVSSEIADSPIVRDDTPIALSFGAIYEF